MSKNQSNAAGAKILLANCYIESGKLKNAEAIIKKMIKIKPLNIGMIKTMYNFALAQHHVEMNKKE